MFSWLRARTQTRWSFVLIYGVVMWGGLCALLATISGLSDPDFPLQRAILAWICFPAGGVIFGLLMYEWQRWLLRRLQRKKAPPAP
jgi:hypothetical protein